MLRKAIGIIALIVSLCMLTYPLVSEKINAKKQEELILATQKEVANADESTLSSALAAARRYNEALVTGGALSESEYSGLLNLSGNGVMGFIEIPCIDVKLAIYHGCDDSVLSKGIGHIYGTSLPVGGKSTHTFLSGHTGMNNQKMLTDLERVNIGDYIYINTLGSTLVYQIDEIKTVLPNALDVIGITQGEDKVTLITCTPYGVNSHRLIVTGSRVALEEEEQKTLIAETREKNSNGSEWEDQYIRAVLTGGIAFFLILLTFFAFKAVRKNSIRKD
ncbi:MAG: class C sortase [Clostridia bacterium]|nr:class C sortase [Clostridia bacterium]